MNIRAAIKGKVKQAGFSLSEGLFGVAIMGIVFVSLYSGMATGFHSIRDSQENLRATQVMLEKFETIRLYNWDQLNTAGFIPPTFTANYTPNEGSKGITYSGRVTIGAPVVAEVYNTDMKAITVYLTWTSGGLTHDRSFTSYVAKYGIQNYIY